MNLSDRTKEFIVYCHVSPGGKRYVGITSQPLNVRWGVGGSEYKSNKHLWSAIQMYGWDCFQHNIIASGLSLDDACRMEKELIQRWNCTDPAYGYNCTDGGECSCPSPEVRSVLKERTAARWKNESYRSHMITKLTGHLVSDATKKRISEAKKGRVYTSPSPLKGRKLSADQLAKRAGRVPWNLGLTKSSDSRILQASEKSKGRVKSEEEIQHISDARREQYHSGYSPVWITDGKIETTIDSAVSEVPEGFVKGRLQRDLRYIYRGSEVRRVSSADLESYLAAGWSCGRGDTTSFKEGQRRYLWEIDGQSFTSAEELASYLRTHGYPKIVGSTITSLFLKGFSSSKMYSDLEGKISRRNYEGS